MPTYPNGTLLKASGPEVDQMEGGQRRGIPDPATFTCMGLNWGAIQTIVDSEWNQIPQGAPYPSWADGALVQGSGPPIYLMHGCQRHRIPDPETFTALGYHASAIQYVSDADLSAIPEGAQLSSVNTGPLDGFIEVFNRAGYDARCTLEYDLDFQHQTVSSGDLSSGSGPGSDWSYVVPGAATTVHLTCEDECIGGWRTLFDLIYPTLSGLTKPFTLWSDCTSPSYMEEEPPLSKWVASS